MIAFDTETTGLNVRKDRVIGFSYYDGKESIYVVHLKWNGSSLVEITPFAQCVEILETFKTEELIMHNAAFDCQVVKNYFGVDLLSSLKIDTVLLAHLLDENRSSYGLKELGTALFGFGAASEQTDLKNALKQQGAGSSEFFKAPVEILSKYARKDVELTYKIAKKLLPQLTPKLSDLFYSEIMPLYKEVVIPMQARGVAINVSAMEKTQAEMASDMEILRNKIESDIQPALAPFYDWFYNKEYPLKTRGKVFTAMKLGLSLREAQEKVCKDDKVQPFNILSKHHLKKLFFDIYKEKPLSYTEAKQPQVDEDFLTSVASKYSFVDDLILYNKLTKVKSTYIDRILEESENGIFYPTYFMHRTVSGRLSGDMQQVPRPLEQGPALLLKYNNLLRTFFVSRPEYIFIDDDYESLEPRVFAAVAGDSALTDIFKNGHDFYSTIAIMVEKLENVSADKKAPNYLGKVNKPARQTAKAYSLGIAYGLDDYKLHKDLNISQNESKKLIAGYFAAFPQLKAWMERTKHSMLTTGQVETRLGRIRRNQEIPALYKCHGDAALNALDLWKKYNENEHVYNSAKLDYKKIRHAINNSYNHQIQGLAAHILNRAAIEVVRAFKNENLDAYIVALIHDEILVECSLNCIDRVKEIMQTKMEGTLKIETPLVAIPSIGKNFLEAKGV